MNFLTVHFREPPHQHLKDAVEAEGVSINRFISLAVVGKFSIVVFAIGLASCSTTGAPSSSSPTSAQWRTRNFKVTFQAGPRERRSFSYYHISHTSENGLERERVMESAHSPAGFQSVTNGDPKNWIRVFEDPNGKALIIEEEIPNDCAPCSNYMWVGFDGEGFITGIYLRLPSAITGPSEGIDYEYPKVQALQGQSLIYRYSTGKVVRSNLQEIEIADSPLPPG